MEPDHDTTRQLPTPVVHRRIILLGKIGSGKSTLVNHIVGDKTCEVRGSVESVTRSTSLLTAPIQATARGYHYTFKLIDTVGIYDRSNHEILKDIRRTFEEEVQSINLVLFVYKDGRLTPEDKTTFEIIMKNFSQLSQISALIVTNCDQKGKSARVKIEQDLQRNAKFISNFVKKGVYTVGFPNLSEIDEDMRRLYEESIEKDEKILQQLADSSEEVKVIKEVMTDSFWTSLAQSCRFL